MSGAETTGRVIADGEAGCVDAPLARAGGA